MDTVDVIAHDSGGWQAEDADGRGNWCYAATTRAVRGTLLGDTRSQQEIAHDFYLRVNSLGGASSLGIAGSRGKAVDEYARQLGQEPFAEPIPFSHVRSWVDNNQLAQDPLPLLGEAWGEVSLDGLTETRVNSLSADEGTETRICSTLHADGLVLVGTAMHFMIIHGYQLDMEDDEVVARRFHVWDPANGASKVVDLSDLDGSALLFVTR